MQIFRNLAEIPPGFGPSVVSVGNFDGVHRGHRWILERVKERARKRDARSVAVTFDPHPACVLRPDKSLRLITPIGARLELLQETGIDAVLVLPFTKQLAKMSATDFADSVLRETLAAIEVHEGANFRFGHHAHAGVRELRALGSSLGFEVGIHPALYRRGIVISSSNVRALIAAGEVRHARSLMGHAFFVQSSPARGRGIGGKLLVPTINLAEYDELLPALGVYITCLRVGDQVFESVTNVGNRPTFGADSFAVESHILNFPPAEVPVEIDETTPLELTFLDRLREEKKFPSPEALRTQILLDVARAQRYFRLASLYRPQAQSR
jgi:riboflavin kinase/FMN adenylyltransferase